MTTTRTVTYLSYEPPHTRPPLVAYARPGFAFCWIANLTFGEACYWASRNELRGHLLRKRYAAEQYDELIVLAEPQATATYTTAQLIERGVLGAYGWRRINNV